MIPPILVTGAARSGTSLTAGVIHLCGAFGGKMSGPTLNNKKGMFENGQIRNSIVKPYLRGIGADPLCQAPLPDLDRLRATIPDIQESWKRRVEDVIRGDGYQEGPWFYKGAKMCLMWPLWHAAFPDARWVIVRRKDEDIIGSCLHTGFMRAYSGVEGWQRWVDVHKFRFEQMREADLDVREVWPEKLVGGDAVETRAMIEEFGLIWQETAVTDFVAPSLWKNGKYVLKG